MPFSLSLSLSLPFPRKTPPTPEKGKSPVDQRPYWKFSPFGKKGGKKTPAKNPVPPSSRGLQRPFRRRRTRATIITLSRGYCWPACLQPSAPVLQSEREGAFKILSGQRRRRRRGGGIVNAGKRAVAYCVPHTRIGRR